MQISVLEFNLASCGGRQQTMISGFADCFAEMGNDVKIYANFLKGHVPRKAQILEYHLADFLTLDNFDFSHVIGRNTPLTMPIKEFNESDMLLIPYPGFSWLGEYVTCPIVSWYIAPPNEWHPEYVARVWTNSHTQKTQIGLDDARVIYAPHNYSIFREQALPWENRQIDILGVFKFRHEWFGGIEQGDAVLTNELEEAKQLHDMGFKVVGLFIAKTVKECNTLKHVPFEHYINVPRKYVAGFMASSKILFHPSPAESCSLMLYEGLNAGCYPVVREAGACREQLENVGIIYNEFNNIPNQVKKILNGTYDVNTSIKQGMKFDRSNTIKIIEEELSFVTKS